MKAVFLNAGLTRALKSHGLKLDGTEGLTNFKDFFTYSDLATMEYETACLLKAPVINEIGLVSYFNDDETSLSDDSDISYAGLFGDTVSPQDAQSRIRTLNCVVTQEGCLVLFEDTANTVNVLENLLLALERIHPIDDILKMPLWSVYLKNS